MIAPRPAGPRELEPLGTRGDAPRRDHHAATDAPVAGVGTGLSLARRVIQDHGGGIRVRSEGEWTTIVTFTLPARGAGGTFANGAQTLTVTTDSQGGFVFDVVDPGRYSVSVEARGFKKTVALNIVVEVSKPARVTIGLELGAVNETVTVTASQDVINTTSPNLTNVINTKQVVDLPLGG